MSPCAVVNKMQTHLDILIVLVTFWRDLFPQSVIKTLSSHVKKQ